jgi:hypothetical protein
VVVSVDESLPAARLFGEGAMLHLILVELPNGEYRVRAARLLPADRGADHDPLPPPLALTPDAPMPWDIAVRAMNGTPSYEEQVVELVNQERWANGSLPPLKQVDLLDNSSGLHSANSQRDPSPCRSRYATTHGPDAGRGTRPTPRARTSRPVIDARRGDDRVDGLGHRASILSTGYRRSGSATSPSSDLATVRLDDSGDTPVASTTARSSTTGRRISVVGTPSTRW